MCEPMMLTSDWKLVRIQDLTKQHTITVLGRELRVEYAVPADRGGDFYILEAYGQGIDKVKDIVSFTLDRNQEVYARLN